jgi:hypothetical protein
VRGHAQAASFPHSTAAVHKTPKAMKRNREEQMRSGVGRDRQYRLQRVENRRPLRIGGPVRSHRSHAHRDRPAPFFGIIPGNAAIPLGSVVLPVTFGETRENYRTEYIKFEVADFETSYHAILGRPAIAKFMVVPHHMYLVLKMPTCTLIARVLEDILRLRQRSCVTRSHESSTQHNDGDLCCIQEAFPK